MKAFANGDRHEGEYCLDLRQGCGTYHWANGDCYEGDWEVCARVCRRRRRLRDGVGGGFGCCWQYMSIDPARWVRWSPFLLASLHT